MAADSLEFYATDAHRYDELRDRTGALRPHWRPLIERLTADGPRAARRGVELAQRLIVENGVTYNVYADPQGKDRPWVLDPLPMVLPAAEWRQIEAGVAQRARLFDALLRDLYGSQQTLTSGVVPAELPFGHPNFLWPCHGMTPPDGQWLHVYAVDLARSPEGSWWVLADRTQTPSGTGYALENRQIVARVLPELIRELGVRPLTAFFANLRERLLAFAPEGETPLAVVLTPGSFNETYFEHAYLARQLGLPLVEGSDLTVRGDTVYLKTLTGLRRVHSILRRLDDDFCDPVELRADSALGVPGLLAAARAGRVMLANALGSGVLESAAWLGFMPGAAEQLLGEQLLLPSVATWWCGERPALEHVIANLDRLVIKPAFPSQRFEPVFGKYQSPTQRQRLIERLRSRPHAYVAQERLDLSQAPVWRSGETPGFAARSLGIRVYAIRTANGFEVMPGGLARIAGDSRVEIVSTQRGGGSKDVWVLGTTADEPQQLTPGARFRVRHDDLPSRLVENLYWFGRYAERCEDKVRLLRATLAVRADPEVWQRAKQACESFGVLRSDPRIAVALFDPDNPIGLTADLHRLVYCATEVRSRLSTEHWAAIGTLNRESQETTAALGEVVPPDPREVLDRLLAPLVALAGLALDDMTQDDGWRLLVLGRRLERLQFLATLISQRLTASTLASQAEVEWLLDIAGSTITYRMRYLAMPRIGSALDLLVRDGTNPRALAFQVLAIQDLLQRLSKSLGAAGDRSVESAFTQSLQPLLDVDLGTLEGEGHGAQAARSAFAAGLDALAAAAARLSDLLSSRHFSHVKSDMHTVAA
jgi:uncharacterized circularly permuted ATP-grasp superfamily protein/uncharacterized alpha-E superfamily protein